MNHLKQIFGILFSLILSQTSWAASPASFTYEGVLTDSSGNAVDLTGQTVTFSIVDAANCVIYQETSTTSGDANGMISHAVGTGSVSYGAFNAALFNSAQTGASSCSVSASAPRFLKISIASPSISATVNITSVPYAFESTAVGGYAANSILRADSSVASVSPLNNTQYTALVNLLAGSSTLYVQQSSPSFSSQPTFSGTPTSANDLTNKSYVDSVVSNALPSIITPGTFAKVAVDAKGRVTSGSALVEADIPTLSSTGKVDGGAINTGTIAGSTAINTTGAITTTGALTANSISSSSASLNQIRIYNGPTNYVQFTAPTLSAPVAFKLPSVDGVAGQVLKTDGAGNLSWVTSAAPGDASFAAKGIFQADTDAATSGLAFSSSGVLKVNSGTGANQIVKLDSSSKIPAIDGSQLTNLSASQITAGTLPISRGGTGAATKTLAFDALSPNSGKGDITVHNGTNNVALPSGSNGQVLTADSSQATGVKWAAASSGTVSSVTAGAGLTGGIITSSGTLSVNAGTGANQIVQLNGSSQLPAVDGSALTGLTASQISSGSLPISRGGTGTNFFAGNGVIVSNLTGSQLSALNCGSGQVITFDSSGYAICGAAAGSYGYVNGGNSFGGNATLGTNDTYSLGLKANNSTRMLIDTLGNVGIGTTSPSTRLHVSGTVQIGDGGESCSLTGHGGMIRYNSNNLQYCNGTSWQTLGISGAGLQNLNGLTTSTQSFVTPTSGTDFTISSAGSAHTIAIPSASATARGLLTSVDWSTFNNKLGASTSFAGDVSGTYNTITVSKIKGTAVSISSLASGNFMKYNGSAWVNSNLASGDVTGALGYTPVNKAGDTMSGALNLGGNDLKNSGNIEMASSKNFLLSNNSSDPTGLVPADKGRFWFNSSTNQIKYYDGSSVQTLGVSGSGLQSFNGSTVNNQTFAVPGTSGTAPAWSTNTGTGVHTLNIPMANTASVTAGLISKTEYDTFNNKLGTSTSLSGDVIGTYNATSVDKIKGTSLSIASLTSGNFLKYNGSAWVNTNLAAGDITSLGVFINNGNSFGAAAALGTNDAFALNFKTNNTTRMTFDNAGKVGIGTTSPTGFLDVRGGTAAASTNGSNIQFYAQNAGAGNANGGHILLMPGASSGSGFWGVVSIGTSTPPTCMPANSLYAVGNMTAGGSATVGTGTGSGMYNIGSGSTAIAGNGTDSTADYLSFATNSSEKMRIDGSGNVGIRTSSPGAPLDVKGEIRMSGTTGGYAGFKSPAVGPSVTWILPAADGSAGQFLKTDGAGNLSWASAASASITSINGSTVASQTFPTPGTAGTAPNWSVNAAAGSHTLNIPMANTASVTAGLISKTEYDTFNTKLGASTSFSGDVTGPYSATTVGRIKGAAVSFSSLGNGQILKYNGSAWVNSVFSINASTDITAGTLSVARGGTGVSSLTSNRLLASDGTGSTIQPVTPCSQFQVISFDGSGNYVCANLSSLAGFVNNGNSFGGVATLGTNDSFALNLKSNNTIRMTIDSNGKIGVGTTAPTVDFEVEKNTSSFLGVTTNSATAAAIPALLLRKNAGTEAAPVDTSGGHNLGKVEFQGYVSGAINDFMPAALIKATQTNSNGIQYPPAKLEFQTSDGTTAPSSRLILDASGNMIATGTLLFPSSFGPISPTGNARMFVKSTGQYETPMRVMNDHASGYSAIDFFGYDGTSKLGIGYGNPTSATPDTAYLSTNASGLDFAIQIVGVSKLTVASTGKVGIGTTNPGYTLHVVGTAGLSTGTAWTNASDIRLKDIDGDYEYGLNEILKLHTVRFHYKKNNALDIPSDHAMTGFIAQEVQKVIPDAIHEREDGYLELNADPIHWATVNAVKDLHGMCKMSEKQIQSIKEQVAIHERRLASIEAENKDLKKANQELHRRDLEKNQRISDLEIRLEKLEKLLVPNRK